MSQISSLISCPQLQGDLNEYWSTCDPTKLREPLVLQQFLYSEANSVGGRANKLKEAASPGGGKRRDVEYIYSPRILESEVDDNTNRDSCTSSNVIGETSTLVQIGDSYVQHDFLVSPFELRDKCKDNNTYIMEKLQQSIDVVLRKRETKLYNALALMYGNFAVGEPDVAAKIKTVQTIGADGRFSTDALEEIPTSTRYAGYCTAPIVLGGRIMGKYMKSVSAGCCAIDGINVGELALKYGMGFLESYRADSSFGVNNFMTIQPGAVQVADWLEYEGAQVDEGTVKLMTITDPETGVVLDLKINMDCNGNMSFFVRSYFKAISLPGDLFYVGDRLAGVNFVNKFVITNP